MNSQKAIIIGVCAVIVLGFFMIKGCSGSSSRKAIESVLEQDKHAADGISTIAEYVQNQHQINLSHCPSDFGKAYRKHQDAWRDMAVVEQEAKQWENSYNSGSAFIESFLRGLVFDFGMAGESRQAAERVRSHHQSASKAISDTYSVVLDIADDYGVDISQYR